MPRVRTTLFSFATTNKSYDPGSLYSSDVAIPDTKPDLDPVFPAGLDNYDVASPRDSGTERRTDLSKVVATSTKTSY